jgi:hypothetical protein
MNNTAKVTTYKVCSYLYALLLYTMQVAIINIIRITMHNLCSKRSNGGGGCTLADHRSVLPMSAIVHPDSVVDAVG